VEKLSPIHTSKPGIFNISDLQCSYNIPMPIPREIQGQNYISLVTFRKSGVAVPTPVWFGERDDKLYVMTRSDSGKYKRLRNNSKVQIAPCTMRGKITGPEFDANARILPPEDWPRARNTIKNKYWLARVPFFWSKKNVYVEIDGFTLHS
jgi:PPOX class probable F420-dependent enzyme